jgi:hypothetical protein
LGSGPEGFSSTRGVVFCLFPSRSPLRLRLFGWGFGGLGGFF